MQYQIHNAVILVDEEDLEKVKKFNWRKQKNGYIIAYTKGKLIYLHRYLLEAKENQKVDHINHNASDNRRENIRICTQSQNLMNRKVRKDSETGIKGVTIDKRVNKYRAIIQLNGRSIWLGYFNDVEKAIQARQLAEIEYHKNFRYKKEILSCQLST